MVLGLSFIAIGIGLAACGVPLFDGFGPPLRYSDPFTDPTTIKTVQVLPNPVFTKVGETFWVDYRVLNKYDRVVSDPLLDVTWIAPPRVVIEGGYGGAWVSVPKQSSRPVDTLPTIQVMIAGQTAELQVVVSDLEKKNTGFQEIRIGPQWTGPGDRGARPSIVLADVTIQGDCREDQEYAIAGGTFIFPGMRAECAPSGFEAAVFSSLGRARLYPTRPDWPKPARSLPANDLGNIILGPRPTMEVVFWKWAKHPKAGGDLWKDMEDELELAQDIFDRGRVGVELKPMFRRSADQGDQKTIPYDSATCTGPISNLLKSLTQNEISASSSRRIHVIYGQKVQLPGGTGARGGHCYWMPTRLPAVVISASGKSPTTLAHELGHLMGMHQRSLALDGHTGPIASIDPSNLMDEHEDPSKAGNRSWLTLGQAYRMAFDLRSWLNRVAPGPRTKCCQQNPYSNRPCPDLWLDIFERPPDNWDDWVEGNKICSWW